MAKQAIGVDDELFLDSALMDSGMAAWLWIELISQRCVVYVVKSWSGFSGLQLRDLEGSLSLLCRSFKTSLRTA